MGKLMHMKSVVGPATVAALISGAVVFFVGTRASGVSSARAATVPIVVHDSTAHAAAQRTALREITQMMDSAAAAWNRGDLDRFVEDYEPDSTTTFIGSKGILRGRAAIRQAYAPRFAPGGVRDSLSFENLEIDLLAPNVLNAIAYYRLMRGDSTIARGPTSLVMRKTDGRWRIIHDHSS